MTKDKLTEKDLLKMIDHVKSSNDCIGLQWFTTEEKYEYEKHYLPNDIEIVFVPKHDGLPDSSNFSMLIPVLKKEKTFKVTFTD